MKKALFLLTLCCCIALCFPLVACGGSAPSVSPSPSAPAGETPQMPDAPSEGLVYEQTEDKAGYVLVSAEGCSDKNLRVADRYKGLPVVEIRDAAFANNTDALSITFGANVTEIGVDVFGNLNTVAAFFVPSENTAFKAIDGSLFSKDGKTMIKYAAGKTDTAYTLPSGVTAIAPGCFNCSYSLTDITLTEGLTKIGASAFGNCLGITSLHFPASLTEVEQDLLLGSSVSELTIAEENVSFTCNNGVLYSKDGKTLLLYPQNKADVSFAVPVGVTQIADYAFFRNERIAALSLPEGLTEIGDSAFEHCTSLTEVILPETLQTIGQQAFAYCGITTLSLSDSVIEMGYGAFYDCDNLTDVEIGLGLKEIASHAFTGCSGLTNVHIGLYVEKIDENAFSACGKLAHLSYDGMTEEWQAIEKGEQCFGGVVATTVSCNNGSTGLTAPLEEDDRPQNNSGGCLG